MLGVFLLKRYFFIFGFSYRYFGEDTALEVGWIEGVRVFVRVGRLWSIVGGRLNFGFIIF